MPDISKLAELAIAFEQPLSPQSLPRLEKLSDAFQRIKYKRLAFRVVPQISTATSGGYVAAFVNDVTDRFTKGEKGLAKLTSMQGSKTCKWWENTTIVPPTSDDLFYTSGSANDPRWSSPGKFVLGVDGKANQIGSLTVFLDWSVELCIPSLEGDDNTHSDIPELRYSVWTKDKEDGLWALPNPKDYTTLTQDARIAIPGTVQPGSVYRVSGMRGFNTYASEGYASKFVGFNKIYVDSKYQMWPSTEEYEKIGDKSCGHTQVCAKGEFLDHEHADDLNSPKGFEYLCHKGMSEPSSQQSISMERPSRQCSSSPITHLTASMIDSESGWTNVLNLGRR